MIKFSSVSKHFPPETVAIDDVSFEIDAGELVLLTGPSGSGKTTIMKLLTKEYPLTSGNIYFSDLDIDEIEKSKIHDHRRKIGVIFQDYKLLPELNVWENIALPLSIAGKQQDEIEKRVTDLLTLVSLEEKAALFPKQLSGGEAQRISIARALSTGPSVIFADEPTGNLDRETSIEIGNLLKKINSLGTTVIFATHDHDIIDMLSNIRHITLENGKLKSDTKKPKKSAEKKNKKSKKENSKNNEDKSESENKTDQESSSPNETHDTQVSPKPKMGFWSRLFGNEKSTDDEAEKSMIEPQSEKDEDKEKNELSSDDNPANSTNQSTDISTEIKKKKSKKKKNSKKTKSS